MADADDTTTTAAGEPEVVGSETRETETRETETRERFGYPEDTVPPREGRPLWQKVLSWILLALLVLLVLGLMFFGLSKCTAGNGEKSKKTPQQNAGILPSEIATNCVAVPDGKGGYIIVPVAQNGTGNVNITFSPSIVVSNTVDLRGQNKGQGSGNGIGNAGNGVSNTGNRAKSSTGCSSGSTRKKSSGGSSSGTTTKKTPTTSKPAATTCTNGSTNDTAKTTAGVVANPTYR